MAGMDALARYQLDLLKNRVAELERWREQLAAADQCASELRNGAVSGRETAPDPDSRVWETPRTPQPTLTNAERRAIEFFSRIDGPGNVPVANQHAATLRGLLKRLG